jgi:hypothetical protein
VLHYFDYGSKRIRFHFRSKVLDYVRSPLRRLHRFLINWGRSATMTWRALCQPNGVYHDRTTLDLYFIKYLLD